MRVLFLGDVVGNTGCSKVKNNLLEQKKIHKIDFVIITNSLLKNIKLVANYFYVEIPCDL